MLVRWKCNSPKVWGNRSYPAGCSKRPSSKAAAREEATRTLFGTWSIRARRERRWRIFSASS